MGLIEKTKREPIRDPNWTFRTGKWAGATIREVLFNDESYVRYLMEKTDFDVHQDLFDEIDERYNEGMKHLYG